MLASRRLVRKRRGQLCRCFQCGKEVYPLPLNVPHDLELPIKRGYAAVCTLVNKRTRSLRLVPCLLCPDCAGPAEVATYQARFERTMSNPCHDAVAHARNLESAASVALTFYMHALYCCKRASGAL